MKLRFDLKYKTLTLAAIPILGLLGAAILMSGIAAKVAAGLVQQGAIYRAFETRQEAFISSINLMINLYYIPVEGPPTGDQGAKQAIAAESHLFLGKVKALQESLSSFSDRPPDTYVDAAQKFDRLGERITGKRLEAGEQKPTDLQRDSLLLNGWSAIGKQLAALDTYLEDLNKSNSETLFREIQGSAITVLLIVAFNWALAIFLAVQYTRKIVRPALEIRRNSGLIGTVAELPAIDCDNDEFRDLSRALNFAHEELLLSTKKMHDLIDWSTALVLTANRKAMITSSNQACRYIIGVSPDNLVNRSLFDFVEAESRARVRQLCSQAGNLKDDIILLTVDGRRVECSMDATFNAERNSYILVIVDKSHENLLTKSRQEFASPGCAHALARDSNAAAILQVRSGARCTISKQRHRCSPGQ
jgi:PAS domain-containing protein